MADSSSAITSAAERGFLDLVILLVQHGAKVSGTGALPAAADNGHMDVLQYLLKQGADINEIGVHDYGDRRMKKYEGTALHKAIARGDLVMAKLLVEQGARIDIEDPLGRTPLMRAREENQQEAAGFLNSIGVYH